VRSVSSIVVSSEVLAFRRQTTCESSLCQLPIDQFCPSIGHSLNAGAAVLKQIVVIGAGKIGSTIARLLSHSGDYHVTVADRSAAQLAEIEAHNAVATVEVDIADRAALEALLAGKFAVLSAAPFQFTVTIAEAAAA